METNTVTGLRSSLFRTLPLDQKILIRTIGRPTPLLNITEIGTSRNKGFKRVFQPSIYAHTPWICGCEVTNKLYCFPCILFGGDSIWANKGTCDLHHLREKIKKHETSMKHLNCTIDLSMIGRVNIASQSDSGNHRAIVIHNQQVAKNRNILSKLIDCLLFGGSFELAQRGHNKTENAINPGSVQGLVHFTRELDSAMKIYLENAIVFKETSKTIKNELLDCMLQVCRDHISEEIRKTSFLAVMADETTDVSEKMQLVIVYRYEQAGQAVERFWGYFNPGGQDAETLSSCILDELHKHLEHTRGKLIAQSYDGAAVMSRAIGGVQQKVRDVYQYAYFVHCYAHQLNLVMQRAASHNTKARIFFSSLSLIPAFFAQSPQRLEALHEIGPQIPGVATNRWNIRTVNIVYEHKQSLLECFETLMVNPKSREVTIRAAAGLLRTLNDPEFDFWLKFFHTVMPHVDILYKQLQRSQSDTLTVKAATTTFVENVQQIRESTVVEPHEGNLEEDICQPCEKVLRVVAAKEVCDEITIHASDRFSFSNHLEVQKLLEATLFTTYVQYFPHKELDIAIQTYPMIEKDRLRMELAVLYARSEFQEYKDSIDLLRLLSENNLESSFCETIKLLRILVTTPMSTVEPERCFSTLQRVKKFLRNTKAQERLCALAMLSTEKKMISEIPDFHTKVIDKFSALKDRQLAFNFK